VTENPTPGSSAGWVDRFIRWATGSSVDRLDRVLVALGTVLVVLREAYRVPDRNELFYLVRLYRTYHPEWLQSDWTLGGGSPEHFLWNHGVGLLGLLLPLEPLGWVVRIAVWVLGVAALVKLSQRLDVPRIGFLAALAIWLGFGQALIGLSWMFMTAEAKTLAYPLLLFGLERVMVGRFGVAGLLGGLAGTAHPSVGLLGGVALFVAVLGTRPRPSQLARFVGLALLGALPGILAVAPTLGGASPDWTYLTVVRMPFHLEPLSWPKPVFVSLAILLAFVVLHAGMAGARPWRTLLAFQGATAVVFGAGVAIRIWGPIDLLQVFPFRLFPLLTPLFFLFAVAHAVGRLGPRLRRATTPLVALVLLGGYGLMTLPEPVYPWVRRWHRLRSPTETPPDIRACYRWVATHTAPDALGVVPPGVDARAWVETERGLVVCAEYHVYDRFPEWQARVEALGGELEHHEGWRDSLLTHFSSLPEERARALSARWGVDFWVTPARYDLPVGFRSGSWTVYLPPRSGTRSDSVAEASARAWSSMATTR